MTDESPAALLARVDKLLAVRHAEAARLRKQLQEQVAAAEQRSVLSAAAMVTARVVNRPWDDVQEWLKLELAGTLRVTASGDALLEAVKVGQANIVRKVRLGLL